MPPRPITAAILIFWLAMTGWLIQKEVVPMMLADVAPSFHHDLTDEIGSPLVSWTVLRDGKRIGFGFSRVEANEDRTFEFHSTFKFDQFTIGPVQITKMESMYRVGEDRKLLSLLTKATLKFAQQEAFTEIRGDVVNDFLEPTVFVDFLGKFEHKLDKIDMAQQGSIVNPMHLVNRLKGLHEGQLWKINMVDPLRSAKTKLLGDFAMEMSMPALMAEVKTGTLTWDRKEVSCYVIEYREVGKEVTARTWARKIDGLVLQQEASHVGFDMVLQRVP